MFRLTLKIQIKLISSTEFLKGNILRSPWRWGIFLLLHAKYGSYGGDFVSFCVLLRGGGGGGSGLTLTGA